MDFSELSKWASVDDLGGASRRLLPISPADPGRFAALFDKMATFAVHFDQN